MEKRAFFLKDRPGSGEKEFLKQIELGEQKGKYVVLYVGQYNDKDEAKQSMKSLQGTYKDCFIRRL